jgi:GTP-binding protein YchF
VFKPKKTTFATMTFVDLPGIPTGTEQTKRRNEILSSIRQFDALITVLDDFTKESVETDLKVFENDLILLDLDVVEKRLEKLKKEKGTPEKLLEQKTLEKFKEALDNEIPLRNLDLTEEEKLITKSFGLFTLKPTLYVVNISEEKIPQRYHIKESLKQKFNYKDTAFAVIPVLLEEEIAELSEAEKKEFLSSYNLEKEAINEVVEETLNLLKLNVFYTVGEDEVRAWLFERGLNAKKVAGVIHSDIERGFIAAEVISYEDFKSVNFSFKDAKAKGLLRIEGANYIVKDKEIVHFRFNI